MANSKLRRIFYKRETVNGKNDRLAAMGEPAEAGYVSTGPFNGIGEDVWLDVYLPIKRIMVRKDGVVVLDVGSIRQPVVE